MLVHSFIAAECSHMSSWNAYVNNGKKNVDEKSHKSKGVVIIKYTVTGDSRANPEFRTARVAAFTQVAGVGTLGFKMLPDIRAR